MNHNTSLYSTQKILMHQIKNTIYDFQKSIKQESAGPNFEEGFMSEAWPLGLAHPLCSLGYPSNAEENVTHVHYDVMRQI